MNPGLLLTGMILLSSVAFAQNDRSNSVSISDICQKYTYVDDQVACVQKFAGKRVSPAAITICQKYTYVDDRVSCALSLADMRIGNAALAICQKYTYVDDQKSCLKELAGLQISESSLAICQKYTYVDDQKACARKLATPAGDGSDQDNSRLIDQLSLVRDAINNGEIPRALSLLTDAINQLKSR